MRKKQSPNISESAWLRKSKLSLTIKLMALVMLFPIFRTHALNDYDAYGKDVQFTLKMENVPMKAVLRSIEEQTEFSFVYNSKLIDVNQKVNIDVSEQNINEVLDELFAGTNINYEIVDRHVLLSRKSISDKSVDQQQQITVRGQVRDTQGNPLPGVTVVVKGTTRGTITDNNGNFSLTIPQDAEILQFSFVGMKTVEVPIAGRTTFNIVMEEETITLEEVVAVGYGTMRKSDLTGSLVSVDSKRLLDKPVFNVAQAISGKAPGVKIIERSGAPGGRPMIRIRGTNSINADNSPLVVVDGVVGVANALTMLNPNEIESIEVLKDASATAIYGARGANGVILITTKRGATGKVQVEYNGNVSRGVLQRHMRSLNAEQFLYVYTQAWKNVTKYTRGGTPNWPLCVDASILPADQLAAVMTYSEYPHLFEKTTAGGYTVPLLGKDGNYYRPRFDTDWESAIFTPSTSTNHQFSIRGGSEKAKIGTFIGYSLEDGLLLNSNINRYSGRITGDFEATKWLDISAQIAVNKNKERSNDVSFFSGGIARGIVEAFPIIPLEYPNDPTIYGEFAGKFGRNLHFPVGEIDHQSPWQISKTVERFTDRSQFTANLELIFKITPDLTFRTNFAADDNSSKFNYYGGIEVTRGDHGRAEINVSKTLYWQNENYFNYNKTIGDHTINGLLGASWSRYSWENLNTWNTTFFDDFYKWHNIGVGTHSRPVPSSGDGQNSLNSYFARINYDYQHKYYLTFTGRVDGSSKFGEDSKYGFFPSGSIAWRISEEDFARDIPSLSNLKLRFSIGQTGNRKSVVT